MSLIINNLKVENLLKLNGFNPDLKLISTTNSTYDLTPNSSYYIMFSGDTGGQRVRLPDSTELSLGHSYIIYNESEVTIPIFLYDNITKVTELKPGDRLNTILKSLNGGNGVWNISIDSKTPNIPISISASYTPNANTGRYLEIYSNIPSNEAPFLVVRALSIITVSLGVVNISTGTIGVFDLHDLNNPIYSISLNNERNKISNDINISIPEGSNICFRVTSGSFSRPYITLYTVGV